MASRVTVEVIGFREASCSPFPCDENRSCSLTECHPGGKLLPAFEALKKELKPVYGDTVTLKFTPLDEGVPGYVREIIDKHYPPLPIILVNGRLTPIGRIVVDKIRAEIEKELAS
ncbi:MAG: hypothetical protein ABFC24_11480 [Methanoregulaceae archaeon]